MDRQRSVPRRSGTRDWKGPELLGTWQELEHTRVCQRVLSGATGLRVVRSRLLLSRAGDESSDSALLQDQKGLVSAKDGPWAEQ